MSISTEQAASFSKRRKALWGGYIACLLVLAMLGWVFPRVTPEFLKSYWALNTAHYDRLLARLPRGVQEQWATQLANFENQHAQPPQLHPGTGRLPPTATVSSVPALTGSVIRYSLDGSVPTAASPPWSQDLSLTGPMLVRARTFAIGKTPSDIVTRTYLPEVISGLPVISLAIDPVHLNDHRAGILANALQRGRAWERRGVMSFLPAQGGTVFECEVAVRVHGNSSRNKPRKRLRIRTPPGVSQIENELHRAVGFGAGFVHTWVLRIPAEITQIYRDRLGNRIAREMGIPVPPAVPCLFLVNGEAWGICDLTPRVDPLLVAGRPDLSGVSLLRGPLARPAAVAGSAEAWATLYQFVEEHDLRDDAAFETVALAIDLDNLMDLWIYLIYAADYDRPQFNMDFFLDSGRDARWRFLAYDNDLGLNRYGTHIEHDTFAWHLRDSPRPDLKRYGSPDTPRFVRSTILFRSLMSRNDFRQNFRARFEQHLEGVLSSVRSHALFDQILAEVEALRDFELASFPRLGRQEAEEKRELEINRIREFLTHRPAFVRRLLEVYLANGPHSMELHPLAVTPAGDPQANSAP